MSIANQILKSAIAALLPTAIVAAQVVVAAPVESATVAAGAQIAPVPAPNTNVWNGLTRSVTSLASGAALDVSHQITPVRVDLNWLLSCHAITSADAAAELELRYEIASPFPQSGNLIIDWMPASNGTGQAALAVDLGGDGTVEATGSATIPVSFQLAPLVVKVAATTNAQAGTMYGPWGTSWSWSGASTAQLRIRFESSHAQTTTIANQACAPAPTLEVLPDLWQGIDLQASAAPEDLFALFALGFQQTQMPLPLSAGCALLVNPVAVLMQPLQPGQVAHQSFAIPTPLRPASFLTQLVTFRPGTSTLTAGDLLQTTVY